MIHLPPRLMATCNATPEHRSWLAGLPSVVSRLEKRWGLTLLPSFDGTEGSCAWVSAAMRADGRAVVLKVPLPHFEAEQEREGLRFWNGDPTVRLLDADDESGGILLERCEPGTPLRACAEEEQDATVVDLLPRLWRAPTPPHPFRPLEALLDHWALETEADRDRWHEPELVREGLQTFARLARTTRVRVLLATDLHAGNILRAQREPWLVIDPKPFIGDPAYDVTQHVLNCRERLARDPVGLVRRLADPLGLDESRVRAWAFARLAAEPRQEWADPEALQLSRVLAR